MTKLRTQLTGNRNRDTAQSQLQHRNKTENTLLLRQLSPHARQPREQSQQGNKIMFKHQMAIRRQKLAIIKNGLQQQNAKEQVKNQ